MLAGAEPRRAPVCERLARAGIIDFMVTPPTIEIANLGMADSLILMVMALVVLGRGGCRRSAARSAS